MGLSNIKEVFRVEDVHIVEALEYVALGASYASADTIYNRLPHQRFYTGGPEFIGGGRVHYGDNA